MKTRINNLRIAHRGLWNKNIPENSMGAFAECVKKGVSIELDVHILKDGELAVFHDDNLKRMTGIDVNIKDLTCKDLRKYKLANSEFGIPLFKEVLEFVNGRVLLDIEIKCDVMSFKICRELVKLLDDYDGEFLVKSFNPLYIWWMRVKRPNFRRGVLVSKLKDTKMPRIAKWVLFKMYLNILAKPDFIAFNKDDLPNKRIAKLHEKNMPILLWTVKGGVTTIEYDGIIYENVEI